MLGTLAAILILSIPLIVLPVFLARRGWSSLSIGLLVAFLLAIVTHLPAWFTGRNFNWYQITIGPLINGLLLSGVIALVRWAGGQQHSSHPAKNYAEFDAPTTEETAAAETEQ